MLLAQLSEQLVPLFPSYAQKDIQTAVRVLAEALDCSDPQHCALAHYNRPLPTLYRLVEAHLIAHDKSAHTIRNVKNNLSRLFRMAEAQQLFSLQPPTLTARYDFYTRPRRIGAPKKNGTYLVYQHWPAALQEAFTAFHRWATDPIVDGRPAALRKRPHTMLGYQRAFEGYFGFLVHIQHIQALTFDHLFDITLLTQFVYWHVNVLHGKTTRTIKGFLTYMLAMTCQYHPLPELHAQLLTLQKNLPIPPPTYNKEDAWVPLSTLREIGEQLWPDLKKLEQLADYRSTGAAYAAKAGLSLMLCLWTYIPYRQRNMREMQLGTNLYQDAHGVWRIIFRGDELKVARKRGRPNVFDLPFPLPLLPHLEEYLTHWRPKLFQASRTLPATTWSQVFLSRGHRPYTVDTLCMTTKYYVYAYTGKHWHPHNIRTVWATEWIRKTHGDFYTAAIMLNDRLETVIARYTYLLDENVAEKAYQLIDERRNHGI